MLTPLPIEAEAPATQRRAWIAEAAYYRAERRGFQAGYPIQDWLAAEREVGPSSADFTSPRSALVFLDRRPASDTD